MKLFMVKLLTAIAVVLTMYASVVMVHDDARKNSKDILTLNRKIILLEDTIDELNYQNSSLTMLVKSLRTSMQQKEIDVDLKVQKVIEDKFKEQSATGGFGVLTGEVAIGNTEVIAKPIEILPEPEPEPEPESEPEPEPEPEPIEEPVVFSCPSPDRSVDFGRYISKISFNRNVRFTIDFDIKDGQITNQIFSKKINIKLKKAVDKYLSDSLDTTNNVSSCSLPFAIEV